MSEKSDSQDIILKFNQIVVLNSLPESNPKPEGQNPKPETIVYEKPDSTRYPNVQTRPDPKPDKVRPVPALVLIPYVYMHDLLIYVQGVTYFIRSKHYYSFYPL